MTSQIPSIAKGLSEVLDAYDAKAVTCPIDKCRRRVPVNCPTCGATASESCGVKDLAAHNLVRAVRQLRDHLQSGQRRAGDADPFADRFEEGVKS